ncbi:hypothetical protein M426DRAFT_10122 [Hypoxylon sp. CI-4A]|nr:hypothetical protein M426DRAFT_10122 [Hypoxylon sp. CI-4A]
MGRRWPDKCEFCIARNLTCTPPRTLKQFKKRNGTYSQALAKHQVDREHLLTPHATEVIEISDSDSSLLTASTVTSIATDSSTPAPVLASIATTNVPPAVKRGKTIPRGERWAKWRKENDEDFTPSEDEDDTEDDTEYIRQLKIKIQTMESQFNELLQTERDKHKKEMEVLEDEHQQELDQQRTKYQTQIDGLVKIMRTL